MLLFEVPYFSWPLWLQNQSTFDAVGAHPILWTWVEHNLEYLSEAWQKCKTGGFFTKVKFIFQSKFTHIQTGSRTENVLAVKDLQVSQSAFFYFWPISVHKRPLCMKPKSFETVRVSAELWKKVAKSLLPKPSSLLQASEIYLQYACSTSTTFQLLKPGVGDLHFAIFNPHITSLTACLTEISLQHFSVKFCQPLVNSGWHIIASYFDW